MANVFYLLEKSVDRPDDVRTYIKVGRPALEILIEHVQGKRRAVSNGRETGTDGRERDDLV